jgi:7,8-dihydropterin-6-yl-methyl-4-(beta-D-ribofuranosyl)aminobenzene 5'-phosphate synthase
LNAWALSDVASWNAPAAKEHRCTDRTSVDALRVCASDFHQQEDIRMTQQASAAVAFLTPHVRTLLVGIVWMVFSASVATAQIPTVDSLEVVEVVNNFYDHALPPDKIATDRLVISKVPNFQPIEVQAEFGLGYVVTSTLNGIKHQMIVDFGLSENVFRHNLKTLGIDVTHAEALVLTHGHQDHWGGIQAILKELKKANHKEHMPPLYVGAHDAFYPKLLVTSTNTTDLGTLSADLIEDYGSSINTVSEPTIIAGGAMLTGFVPQVTSYEHIPPTLQKVLPDGTVTQDDFREEVSVVFNVRGQGLVVITSCAHRGVINILKYAQQITNVSAIAAQIGGWHTQNAPQTVLGPMIADFQALGVVNIVPMHCSGPAAVIQVANSLPASFIQPSVGTHYVVRGTFGASDTRPAGSTTVFLTDVLRRGAN